MKRVKEVITDWKTGDVTIIKEDAPPLTIEEIARAIDAKVEEVARDRQYNSAAHIASYVASTVPAWQAEATAFVAWRDKVWLHAFQLMGTLTEIPELEEVISGLPQITWPEN
jgi:hypothetical protein